MGDRVKEFWGQFGIEGAELLFILRKLGKKDIRKLTNREKLVFIKDMYKEKVQEATKKTNEDKGKLNKIRFQLNIANSRLGKKVNEEKFFKNEDLISKYEILIESISDRIRKEMQIIKKNQPILEKLEKYLTTS